MQLSELFVSHKQVDPVKFTFAAPELPKPIYLNAERAKKVTSDEVETPVEETSVEDDMTTWKVDGSVTPDNNPKATVSQTSTSKRWTSPYTDRRTWISDMTAAYKRAGLGDVAIRNLIAKNALESGWGRSAQGDYNFGNITTGSNWGGRFVQGGDHNSEGNRISQRFRAYDSLDDFVKDEIQFLTKLYDFNPNDDFNTFINKLQGGNKGKRRYAEDIKYSDKVKSVYNSI